MRLESITFSIFKVGYLKDALTGSEDSRHVLPLHLVACCNIDEGSLNVTFPFTCSLSIVVPFPIPIPIGFAKIAEHRPVELYGASSDEFTLHLVTSYSFSLSGQQRHPPRTFAHAQNCATAHQVPEEI